MPKRYVVTGAPGAGKTSLLRALQERHWSVVEEAATDVIAREQATGRDEPWADSDFISKIAALQRQRQLGSADVDVQFYDRSPLCTLALALFLQQPVSRTLTEEITRVTQGDVRELRLLRPPPRLRQADSSQTYQLRGLPGLPGRARDGLPEPRLCTHRRRIRQRRRARGGS